MENSEEFRAKLLYKREELGYSKYGSTKDSTRREKEYNTHTSQGQTDKVFSVLSDDVDEHIVHKFIESTGGKRYKRTEFYTITQTAESIIDSDETLKNFYKHLCSIGFRVSGRGKKVDDCNSRIQNLSYLFGREPSATICDIDVYAISNLLKTKKEPLGNNVLSQASVDTSIMKDVLSSGYTVDDLLKYWFEGNTEIL